MPKPGDYGVTATSGNWRDRIISTLIRWDTSSPVNHAFVYVGSSEIIEAEPNGADYNSSNAYPNAVWSHMTLTDDQRVAIVSAAQADLHKPYGWLDIACIAFVQKRWFHGRLGTNWLWRRIATRVSGDGTMICSQLVDNAYETAGVHLFTDGRPQGSVSPGDLYRLIYGHIEGVST